MADWTPISEAELDMLHTGYTTPGIGLTRRLVAELRRTREALREADRLLDAVYPIRRGEIELRISGRSLLANMSAGEPEAEPRG